MKGKLTCAMTAVDGADVKQLQKAVGVEVDKGSPGEMFIEYTNRPGEAWQEIKTEQNRDAGYFEIPNIYSPRREVASAQLKDLRYLYDCIPTQYSLSLRHRAALVQSRSTQIVEPI